MNSPVPSPEPLLRFEVSPSAAGVQVRAVESPAPAAAKKTPGNPKRVKIGSAEVVIYGKHPGPWTLAWREAAHGPRLRATRSDWLKAKVLAERIATNIANGHTAMNQFGENDRASYLRSLQLAQPIGQPIELIVAKYVELVQKLGDVTPEQAAQFFLEHRPVGITPKDSAEIVKLLIGTKRADGKGEKWIRNLDHQLGKFAEKFPCPLHLVQAHDINAWLRGLGVGLHTRKNYRNALRELVRYAQAENFLDKSWDALKHVDDPEPGPVEARIYTPEEMNRLLACAPPKLIAFLAILAFAGVRHEEMSASDKPLMDWADVLWDKKLIRIRSIVGKTKRRRLIKMHDNLVAWLTPRAKRSGPICELKCTGDALYRLGKRAGIEWIKNACRKGFISYRLAETNDIGLVAREAGNSQKIIESNYLELVTELEAKKWFAIAPAPSERIVQMDLMLA